MLPRSEIFIWYILVTKVTFGAENLRHTTINAHYSSRKERKKKNISDSRIIISQNDINVEHSALVWTALRTWYGTLPSEKVVSGGDKSDTAEVLLCDVGYFAADAFEGHLG